LGETTEGGLIHIELQSTNDHTMPLRMGEYCLAIYRRYGKFARQIVVYVGKANLTMTDALIGPALSFRYDLLDLRLLDTAELLARGDVSDSVIGLLGRVPDTEGVLRRLLARIAALDSDRRLFYLRALFVIAGLRGLAKSVEREASSMPVIIDILENEVLGREIKRGARTVLRLQLEKKFGPIPSWLEERLSKASLPEIEDLSVRLLDAPTLADLIQQ
jgi:predicted transposase YdaD